MTELQMGLELSSVCADVLANAFMSVIPFQEFAVWEIWPKVEYVHLTIYLLKIVVGLPQNTRDAPSWSHYE